jgi:hypothetical protein
MLTLDKTYIQSRESLEAGGRIPQPVAGIRPGTPQAVRRDPAPTCSSRRFAPTSGWKHPAPSCGAKRW